MVHWDMNKLLLDFVGTKITSLKMYVFTACFVPLLGTGGGNSIVMSSKSTSSESPFTGKIKTLIMF